MSRITVIGAGPLGRATIAELTRQGHDVTVASRSRVTLPAATWVPVDVVSGKGLDQLPASEAIVVCFGPPYAIAAWQRIWPVAIDNLIGAAQANDATLVLTGNLYAYARDRMPMRATDPLRPSTALGEVRAEVTRRLFAAHEQGRIRAVEVRGSDYLGADAPDAYLGRRLITPLLAGKAAGVIGDPDADHTWTAVSDFGRLLARGATDQEMAGRAWHVPSAPAISVRDLATRALRIAGVDAQPRFRTIPPAMVTVMGYFSAQLRAVASLAHQWNQPYVMDDLDTRELLRENHTELDDTLRAIVDAAWARPA